VTKKPDKKPAWHSIYVHDSNCNGCVVCLRACPTRAIRVKQGKAVILPELCIDCGECIRVCPNEALVPRVSTYKEVATFKIKAVFPSPALYNQFGKDTLPNDILLALTKLGFDYVFDIGVFCEMVSWAQIEWLKRNPDLRPIISFMCPVVVRLIAKRFPNLIPHFISIEPPRETAAKYIRRFLHKKTGLADEAIGVFQITPCAAKMVAINRPMALKKSYLNGALGISDIYGDILLSLKEITEEDRDLMLFRSSGLGIGWDTSGGEAAGLRLNEPTLAASGLAEVIEVLEQIEAGQLKEVAFVECRACPDGCLGGPLTVENRYMARSTVTNLVQMFGTLPRVRPRDVDHLIREGFFSLEKEIKPLLFPLDKDPLKAIEKLERADEITARLPGRLCGACGAPDCRTLAEDVVLGKAQLSDCPFADEALLAEFKEEDKK